VKIKQDLFISHASSDKACYVKPLAESLMKCGVTFWLDTFEIGWGDSLTLKINEGLRESRYFVLCLSEAFLARPWPETELNAAFAVQTNTGKKKILPLILNSKEKILEQYPIIAGLVYREYDANPDEIAEELTQLSESRSISNGLLHVVVESIHTGSLSNLIVSSQASVKWLVDQAKKGSGLKEFLDTGGFEPFRIRWVLVDSNAEKEWQSISAREKRQIYAIVKTEKGIQISIDNRDRLANIGVYDNIIFHLYAVQDNGCLDISFVGG
jgi:hypothetical protein